MKYFFIGWTAQYEKTMIANLALRHDVRTITVPNVAKRLNRYLISINKRLKSRSIGNQWLASRILSAHNESSEDILICNEGQSGRGLNPSIIQQFKGKKVLLVRDLVDASYVRNALLTFDNVYSFDKAQCEELGMQYMDQFFPYGIDDAKRLCSTTRAPGVTPTCFFLGRDKGRVRAIESMAHNLQRHGCIADFHIAKDYSSSGASDYYIDDILPYDENIQRSLQADILVDINQEGQSGITLRVLESIFFNKKLITCNQTVDSLNLFRPENIFIVRDDTLHGLQDFIATPVRPVPEATLHHYSPDHMLEQITADMSPLSHKP